MRVIYSTKRYTGDSAVQFCISLTLHTALNTAFPSLYIPFLSLCIHLSLHTAFSSLCIPLTLHSSHSAFPSLCILQSPVAVRCMCVIYRTKWYADDSAVRFCIPLTLPTAFPSLCIIGPFSLHSHSEYCIPYCIPLTLHSIPLTLHSPHSAFPLLCILHYTSLRVFCTGLMSTIFTSQWDREREK